MLYLCALNVSVIASNLEKWMLYNAKISFLLWADKNNSFPLWASLEELFRVNISIISLLPNMLSNFNKKRKTLKPLRSPPAFKFALPSTVILVCDEADADEEEEYINLHAISDYEDDSDWSRSSEDSEDSEMCDGENNLLETVTGQLKEAGIEIHLESELIARSDSTVKTMINRYSKLLVWFYLKFEIKGSDINALQLLKDLVLERFQMLIKYYKHLRESLQLKPATVYNLNEDVSVLLNWFIIFRVAGEAQYSLTSVDLYGVNLIIKAMRKFYSKERRVLACKNGDNTIESLISLRKWPQGGLKELHDAVLSQMLWARKVYAEKSYIQDNTVYNNYLQLTCASFYTGTRCLNLKLVFNGVVCFRLPSRACGCIQQGHK